MKLEVIKQAVTSKAARQVLLAQKHSPQILFAGGVVGVVATVVLASKATLKVEDVLKKAESDRKMVDGLKNAGHNDYTEKDAARDKTVILTKTSIELAKLYAPAVIVGVASIAALTGSHVILNRRNVALTAAYNTVSRSYEEYRKRVRAELGEEKDREFKYGVEEHEVYSEKKNGEPKVDRVKRAAGPSMYARLFDQHLDTWVDNPDYNMAFLRGQQQWANDRLRLKGHVLLNDVYDKLGIDRTPEGALVGWVYESETGDGFVDFGIFNGDRPQELVDFMTGREKAILLDFNVEGIVYDQIGKPAAWKRGNQ